MINHGIFKSPLPRFYQIHPFCVTFKELASVQKVYSFLPFRQNVANAKFEQRDSHGKIRNGNGKVVEMFFFIKSVGTLKKTQLLFAGVGV